ncbi:MAG: dTMP kinase [Gemmatimonadota bacterium]|nr:dTMP kinase [Gemmatimonadota bacterium]
MTTEGPAGLFLVFEGVEGAGKTTHLRRLSRRLDDAGIAHLVVREPGATVAGESVRRIVLDPASELHAETELLLILAARAEFVRRIVAPALARGELVLADRYELSTLAYQGAGRGLGVERVRALNAFATGGLKPAGTVLLQVESLAGRGRKVGAADRMEREDDGFHARVAEAYAHLAASEPHVIPIDSAARPDEVHARIWGELSRRWPERFPPA